VDVRSANEINRVISERDVARACIPSSSEVSRRTNIHHTEWYAWRDLTEDFAAKISIARIPASSDRVYEKFLEEDVRQQHKGRKRAKQVARSPSVSTPFRIDTVER
jgi:hypothetical protein